MQAYTECVLSTETTTACADQPQGNPPGEDQSYMEKCMMEQCSTQYMGVISCHGEKCSDEAKECPACATQYKTHFDCWMGSSDICDETLSEDSPSHDITSARDLCMMNQCPDFLDWMQCKAENDCADEEDNGSMMYCGECSSDFIAFEQCKADSMGPSGACENASEDSDCPSDECLPEMLQYNKCAYNTESCGNTLFHILN